MEKYPNGWKIAQSQVLASKRPFTQIMTGPKCLRFCDFSNIWGIPFPGFSCICESKNNTRRGRNSQIRRKYANKRVVLVSTYFISIMTVPYIWQKLRAFYICLKMPKYRFCHHLGGQLISSCNAPEKVKLTPYDGKIPKWLKNSAITGSC